MKRCDLCDHAEVCGWRKDMKEQGCEHYCEHTISIPIGATNGDVIKALFPNEKWERCPENRYNRASMQSDNMGINMELWNTPYKSESDKSADTFEKLLDSGFYEAFRKEDNNADCD